MLNKISILLLLTFLVFTSCGDRCDEGHTEEVLDDGTVICTPDFIFGSINDFNLGDRYYHDKYGIITTKDGIWLNKENQVVYPD